MISGQVQNNVFDKKLSFTVNLESCFGSIKILVDIKKIQLTTSAHPLQMIASGFVFLKLYVYFQMPKN